MIRIAGQDLHGRFLKMFGTFSLLLSLLTISAAAQSDVNTDADTNIDTVSTLPGITVETSVDRAEMYIGDLINYQLVITYDSTYELIPPPLGANLGAFDVKDYKTDQITRLEDGRLQSRSSFTLSTFTTGDYVIPPMPAIFNLPDGTRKAILSESVPITVKSLLGDESDSTDIRPLKPPYEFERDLTRYYIYGGAAFLVLLIAALLLLRRLRRKSGLAEPVDNRKPWEIAFERLALLSGEDLISQKKYKQYYFELTETAREYLGRMYDIDTLEMTTDEFFAAFLDVKLPDHLYDEMRHFFSHADLVKFARLIPEDERAHTDFEFVHRMIDSVRAEFERRLQVEMAVNRKNGPVDDDSPKEVAT